jgi:hypothetical protein
METVEMYQIFDSTGKYVCTLSISEDEIDDFNIDSWIRFYQKGGKYTEILVSQKHDLTENPSGNKL